MIEDENADSEDSHFTQRPSKKKGTHKLSVESAVNEEVEDYNGEDFNRRETYQAKKTKTSKKTDYDQEEDFHATKSYRGNKSNKQRIPGYGISTNPDYDIHAKEPVTVFGPAIAPSSGEAHQKILGLGGFENESIERKASQIVSTEFETDNDLTTVPVLHTTPFAPTAPAPHSTDTKAKDTKKDYVDYDSSDVTIPPNLTDLLANLPEDINADSLQKMFKDSVADRRALLQGFDMLINKVGFWKIIEFVKQF